jgi:hypothetical protein
MQSVEPLAVTKSSVESDVVSREVLSRIRDAGFEQMRLRRQLKAALGKGDMPQIIGLAQQIVHIHEHVGNLNEPVVQSTEVANGAGRC